MESVVGARRTVFELRRVKRRRQRRATINTLHNSGESGDRELKCRRDHRGGLLRIRATFGGRPPSRFRVTAGTKNIQRRVLDVGQMSAAFGERGRSRSGDLAGTTCHIHTYPTNHIITALYNRL